MKRRRAKAQHIATELMAGARSAAKEPEAKSSERAFHVIGWLQQSAELTTAEKQELDSLLLLPPLIGHSPSSICSPEQK